MLCAITMSRKRRAPTMVRTAQLGTAAAPMRRMWARSVRGRWRHTRQRCWRRTCPGRRDYSPCRTRSSAWIRNAPDSRQLTPLAAASHVMFTQSAYLTPLAALLTSTSAIAVVAGRTEQKATPQSAHHSTQLPRTYTGAQTLLRGNGHTRLRTATIPSQKSAQAGTECSHRWQCRGRTAQMNRNTPASYAGIAARSKEHTQASHKHYLPRWTRHAVQTGVSIGVHTPPTG